MSVSRDEVIAEARKWAGTPFEHQGRGPHVLDCVGLVILPLRAMGIDCPDRESYDRFSAGAALPESLALIADRIPLEHARKASLLTFWRSKPDREEHVAWKVGPTRILHAWIKGQRKVVEVELDGRWLTRLVGAWDVRGVA